LKNTVCFSEARSSNEMQIECLLDIAQARSITNEKSGLEAPIGSDRDRKKAGETVEIAHNQKDGGQIAPSRSAGRLVI
jgi:hypothetical protein